MDRRKFIKGSAIIGASAITPALISCSSGMYANATYRKVHKIISADRTMVGTLPILRAFAGDQNDYVSPYVMFDEFGPVEVQAGNDPLRVDAHPHAGVIPTTYFLEGSGHHKDSLNYDFQIGKGDFMMFSSGKGAIHMEETGQKLHTEGGVYHGFQIWLNMPSKYKFIDPATYVFNDENMDTLETKAYNAKIILGEMYEAKSKIELLSPAFYFHIKIKPNGRLDIPTDPTHNAFIYVVNGDLEIEGQKQLSANQVALYQRGDALINAYSKDGAEILALGGQPLNEVVYSYGPFVMNSREQINLCIQNYRTGKMGNPDVVNQ
jgi:redox-sensitive bicupin YhaK (pirin superfamily)